MTFGELKRLVAAKVHDSQMRLASEALYDQWINDSVDDLKSAGWLLPQAEDETIVMANDTYSYTVPAGFAYVQKLLEEDASTAGLYDWMIPYHMWRIAYDTDAASPVFIFNSVYWTPNAPRKIKVVGQKRPPKYTAESTTVEDGHVGFLRTRAEAAALMYFSNVNVEDSPNVELIQQRVAVANQRIALANALLVESRRFLAYHPQEFRVKPNSRHVPTR